MKSIAVFYKSKYGGAKQYAQWIAAALEADLLELSPQTAKSLGMYKTVIFGAGIYAGGLSGIRTLRKNWSALRDKRVIIFTVGLQTVDNPEKFAHMLSKNLTPEMNARCRVFHFRGGIDYARLSAKDRLMMSGLRFALSRMKPDKLPEDAKIILSTYGKSIAFEDEGAIEPLLNYVASRVNE